MVNVTLYPGTTSWLVPSYASMTVSVYGPGGGGGGGGAPYYSYGQHVYPGTSGYWGSSSSSFTVPSGGDALVSGSGTPGPGGTVSGNYHAAAGANGAAYGGSTNTTGGGSQGGIGGNPVYNSLGGWAEGGGNGGYGGFSTKTFTIGDAGAPVPGTYITIAVGTGGAGGPGAYYTGGGGNSGSGGYNGSIGISYTILTMPAFNPIISAGVSVLGTPAYTTRGSFVASATSSAGVSILGTPAVSNVVSIPSSTAIISGGVDVLGTPIIQQKNILGSVNSVISVGVSILITPRLSDQVAGGGVNLDWATLIMSAGVSILGTPVSTQTQNIPTPVAIPSGLSTLGTPEIQIKGALVAAAVTSLIGTFGSPSFHGISGLPVATPMMSVAVASEGTPVFLATSVLTIPTAISGTGINFGIPIFSSIPLTQIAVNLTHGTTSWVVPDYVDLTVFVVGPGGGGGGSGDGNLESGFNGSPGSGVTSFGSVVPLIAQPGLGGIGGGYPFLIGSNGYSGIASGGTLDVTGGGAAGGIGGAAVYDYQGGAGGQGGYGGFAQITWRYGQRNAPVPGTTITVAINLGGAPGTGAVGGATTGNSGLAGAPGYISIAYTPASIPIIINAGILQYVNATSITPGLPATIEGDLLLAIITDYSTWGSGNTGGMTAPAGWNFLFYDENVEFRGWVYWKIASGSGVNPNFHFAVAGPNMPMCAQIIGYRGANPNHPIVVKGGNTGPYNPHYSPSFNSTYNKSWAIALDLQYSPTMQATVPAGWVQDSVAYNLTGNMSYTSWSKPLAGPASPSGAISVAEQSINWIQYQLELATGAVGYVVGSSGMWGEGIALQPAGGIRGRAILTGYGVSARKSVGTIVAHATLVGVGSVYSSGTIFGVATVAGVGASVSKTTGTILAQASVDGGGTSNVPYYPQMPSFSSILINLPVGQDLNVNFHFLNSSTVTPLKLDDPNFGRFSLTFWDGAQRRVDFGNSKNQINVVGNVVNLFTAIRDLNVFPIGSYFEGDLILTPTSFIYPTSFIDPVTIVFKRGGSGRVSTDFNVYCGIGGPARIEDQYNLTSGITDSKLDPVEDNNMDPISEP